MPKEVLCKPAACLLLMVLAALSSGCVATINETHYFGTYERDGEEPVNFFRLKIYGHTNFSSARYVSGYYDERAVDLFFNELRTATKKSPALFTTNLVNPGTDEKIQPLSPGVGDGAFLMILSTDADAVANTIGNFAESEVVAEAITNLVSSDSLRRKALSDARLAPQQANATALATQLESLLPATTAPDPGAAAATQSYIRALSVLAQSLGYRGSFETFEEARRWFTRTTRENDR